MRDNLDDEKKIIQKKKTKGKRKGVIAWTMMRKKIYKNTRKKARKLCVITLMMKKKRLFNKGGQ